MYLKQIKDVLTLYGRLIILKVIMETKYQNLINYIREQISDGQICTVSLFCKISTYIFTNTLCHQVIIVHKRPPLSFSQLLVCIGLLCALRGDHLCGQLHFPKDPAGNAEYFI